MKFIPLYGLVVVGVVSASPIAVPQQPPEVFDPHVRFGYALGQRDVQNYNQELPRLRITTGAIPCAGARSRFRQKSIELSNAFRQALGMPVIEVHAIQLQPLPSHPSHTIHRPLMNPEHLGWHTIKSHPHPHPHRPGHKHAHPHAHVRPDGPFMMRLHFALMSLGRWEGRAVAFVLGCGIGVLIRMIWVLAVVAYRAVKGNNNEEEELDGYLRLSETTDAEEIFVAPPQYVVDEKVAPVDDEN